MGKKIIYLSSNSWKGQSRSELWLEFTVRFFHHLISMWQICHPNVICACLRRILINFLKHFVRDFRSECNVNFWIKLLIKWLRTEFLLYIGYSNKKFQRNCLAITILVLQSNDLSKLGYQHQSPAHLHVHGKRTTSWKKKKEEEEEIQYTISLCWDYQTICGIHVIQYKVTRATLICI